METNLSDGLGFAGFLFVVCGNTLRLDTLSFGVILLFDGCGIIDPGLSQYSAKS